MVCTTKYDGFHQDYSYHDRLHSEEPNANPAIRLMGTSNDIENHSEEPLKHVEQAYLICALPNHPKLRHSTPDLVTSIYRVCFIGAGYVGGPTASVLALHNPRVRFDVVDNDETRVKEWQSCRLPIHEPDLDKVVRIARDGAEIVNTASTNRRGLQIWNTVSDSIRRHPNLFFSNDVVNNIAQADAVFLAVNTPTVSVGSGSGRATNMSIFDTCIDQVARHAKPGAIIVEKSTVPCGTAQHILNKLRTQRPGINFEVLSNPEFLAEGSAIKNLLEPDRIVIGSSPTSPGHVAAQQLARLYSWVPHDKILISNLWSSELSKLAANAMLAQRISSINSIGAICEKTGADINEVAKAVGLDARIGSMFLESGLGFGGSCFRKDIASLAHNAESLGLEDVAHYWTQVNAVNESQRSRFTSRVMRSFNETLAHKKIVILGFAFKKNTGDVRDSIAIVLIKTLLEEYPAEIAIYDPYCRAEDITSEIDRTIGGSTTAKVIVKVYNSPYPACVRADAILIVNDCEQFSFVISDRQINSNCLDTQASRLRACPHVPSCRTESTTQFTVKSLNFYTTYQLLRPPVCASVGVCTVCRTAPRSQALTSQSLPLYSETLYTNCTTVPTQLDWAAIIQSTNQPTRIFDGRHVLKHEHIEKLAAELGRTVILESLGLRSKQL